MENIRQDLRYAARSLLRARGFTAAVVVTLALGIGATSAIFSVIDAVLLRPLPFPDADRVVNLKWDGSGHRQAMSAAKFHYWHDHARPFAAVATWRPMVRRVDIAEDGATVRSLAVSRGFLQVVRGSPALGRAFEPADFDRGDQRIAIVSDAMWRTRFGSAPDVIGRVIRLDGDPVAVVGVLPASFAFPYEENPIDLIVPLRLAVDPDNIAEDWPAIARLRDGVTHAQAQAEVAALTTSFRAAYPNQASPQDRGMTLAGFSDLYVDAGVRRALWILMSAVAFVLLIACANVANVFLARAAARRREIAVRAALGATQARITRLVLTESVLVAAAAGVLGLMIGTWVASALASLTPVSVPRIAGVGRLDWRVVAFTSLGSLVTSVVFGSAAAWPAARARVSEILKDAGRGSSSRSRLRQGLLVAQSALSMVLLAGAGLLVATLIGLWRADAGFDREGLVAVRLPSSPATYQTPPAVAALQQRVIERLVDSPVVASVAGATTLPFERGINTPMAIDGRPDAVGTVEWRAITPNYFQALAIPLRAGRAFTTRDGAADARVAIVNETFARRYFADGGAIGRRIQVGRAAGRAGGTSQLGPGIEIVGIAADIRDASLRSEPRRTIYVPQAQAPAALANVLGTMPVFIARPRFDPGDAGRAVAEALRAVDATLPTPEIVPLDEVVSRSLARERFGAALLTALAALALTLTALGIHGVLAYAVQQRRREIGIRLTLGAGGAQVVRMLIVQGIGPVLIGLIAGLIGALALSRAIAGFLWGVTPTDPATLAAVASILLAVAVTASWLASRRAAADPINRLIPDP